MRFLVSFTLTVLFFLSTVCPAADKPKQRKNDPFRDLKKADCHLHLVDFLQNGEYWSLKEGRFIPPSPGSAIRHGMRHQRIEGVLKRMDAANVTHAMITGMPYVKKWSFKTKTRPTYYLSSDSRVVRARDTDYTVALAIEDFRAKGKDAEQRLLRLFPFICGFDGTDMGAVDMIVKRIKEFPGLWEGIGEVMSRHDDLTNLTTGERPTANHPALHRICNFAGAWDLPVSIHHNIAPVSSNGRARHPLYLPELLELFDEHPKTSFVWCHAGISRRVVVDGLPKTLQRVLTEKDRHKHVWIDLSWVVYEDYILKDLDAWAALIKKYPDNFMIGSDKVGSFAKYSEQIRKYETLLDALGTDAVAKKVGRDNFLRIMPKRGLKLPADYKYPESRYSRLEAPKRGP